MPQSTTLQTDFDDEIEVDDPKQSSSTTDQQNTQGPESAKDEDGVPYCRKHHCRMKRVSGGKKGNPTVYYKCPVDGCDCKAQMIRTKRESVVPPNPVTCPRCSTEKESVVCERSDQFSRAASVVLQCPQCNWKSSALVVPSLAAQHFSNRATRRYADVAGVGDR